MQEEEEFREKSRSNTLPYRRKKKGLAELWESFSHPRRFIRISERVSKAGSSSSFRDEALSNTVSDRDIKNCNIRWRSNRILGEPSNLWGIGKQAGIICHGDEEEVVKEYVCRKERDLEYVKGSKEGKKNG